jgi:phenylacetate-CoA ligase
MNNKSKFITNIISYLPQVFKNIAISVYGQIQRNKRYGTYYKKWKLKLYNTQFVPSTVLKQEQLKITKEFINTSLLNNSFYMKSDNYPKRINIEEDIYHLPILTKKDIRKSLDSLYSQDLKKAIWSHTSGTTGTSISFPIKEEIFQREYAFRQLHYSWGGVSLDRRDKIAIIAGHKVTPINNDKPPFWVTDYINNWLYFSSYHLSEHNLKSYIDKLDRFNPKMIHGYPSSLFMLAMGYEKYGKGSLRLKSIFSSSETLLENQRSKIENVFGVKVYNWYGTSEMNVNIVECEYGELHLKYEHSFVEILNNKNMPCKPGETGRIISTNVGNNCFPLLRYEVGDSITLSMVQTSKCGRSGLLVDQIIGRNEDYIITTNGRFVGRLDHIFKDTVNIKEAQIQQDIQTEVILRIVPDSNFSKKDELLLVKEAKYRLGKDMIIIIEKVDHIKRTSNGKFNFIISNIQSKLN